MSALLVALSWVVTRLVIRLLLGTGKESLGDGQYDGAGDIERDRHCEGGGGAASGSDMAPLGEGEAVRGSVGCDCVAAASGKGGTIIATGVDWILGESNWTASFARPVLGVTPGEMERGGNTFGVIDVSASDPFETIGGVIISADCGDDVGGDTRSEEPGKRRVCRRTAPGESSCCGALGALSLGDSSCCDTFGELTPLRGALMGRAGDDCGALGELGISGDTSGWAAAGCIRCRGDRGESGDCTG